jgi:hypothetical protein
MQNIYSWLPFEADTATCDRPRKWASHNGRHEYNTGKLLDVTQFIPRTDKALKQQQTIVSMENMNAIQRWFASRIQPGNRSNLLLRYALVLLDSQVSDADIYIKVSELNSKLDQPITPDEITSTIMKTIYRKSGATNE